MGRQRSFGLGFSFFLNPTRLQFMATPTDDWQTDMRVFDWPIGRDCTDQRRAAQVKRLAFYRLLCLQKGAKGTSFSDWPMSRRGAATATP